LSLLGVVVESKVLLLLGAESQAFAQHSRIARSGLLVAPGEQSMERHLVWYSLARTIYPSGGDIGGEGSEDGSVAAL